MVAKRTKTARLGGRRRDAVLAVAMSGALLLSMIALMPAHGAAPVEAVASLSAVSAERGPRLASPVVRRACAGQAWMAESRACLEAITAQGGRVLSTGLRIINKGEPDSSRPNVY